MKPTQKSNELSPLLAFGAHPDDIEFGCGGVIARETAGGRQVHFVVCSKGEAGSHGTPEQRAGEAEKAAGILGVTIEFVEVGGDAHFEVRAQHAISLAKIIRKVKPGVLLAPTLVENQHPDHFRLGRIVRDSMRLARYGGLKELNDQPSHTVGQLFFYAVSPEGEPRDRNPILVDVSPPEIMAKWTSAMEAHQSQTSNRNYVELQLARARVLGITAGVGHAMALFPNDPVLVESLSQLGQEARR